MTKRKVDRPEPGKVYNLTGFASGQPSIAKGNSWAESEVHDCDENAVPYLSDGALGHGWECGVCGKFLQAG